MNIIQQTSEKINGVFQTFDRMIINGYLLDLCFDKHFKYYLIQKNVLLKDFSDFALKQTNSLCANIEQYIRDIP